MTNSLHVFAATQLVPFVTHPVKKASHASSVVPVLSVQILFLHLFDVSHPHLPVPSALTEAALQTVGFEYLSHEVLVTQPAPVVVQAVEN